MSLLGLRNSVVEVDIFGVWGLELIFDFKEVVRDWIIVGLVGCGKGFVCYFNCKG